MTTSKLPREIYNLFNGRTFHNFTHLKGDFTMNNNEIMNNEVVEATEEVIENAGLSKGVKIAAGIGLSVVVGVIVYKYVAKPVIANIKAQIEQKKMTAEDDTVILEESDVTIDDN
jgi:hypothetical protein